MPKLRLFSALKKNGRPILLVAVIVIVGLGIAGTIYELNKHANNASTTTGSGAIKPENTVDLSPATSSDNAANNSRKSAAGTSPNSNLAPTLDSHSSSTALAVTVTRATVDTQGQQVIVGTLVNGATSGTCTVTISKAGYSSLTASNQIAQQNNTYVCPNFTFPLSQFPAHGDWQVSVTVSSNGTQATGAWPDPISIN